MNISNKLININNFFINFTHEYIPLILLFAIPIVYITGPFLPDLFLCLIGFYFLVISIKRKLWFYYKNQFVYFFILFYLYINLRSIISVDPYFSFSSSLFYFRYLFYALGIAFIFNNFPKAYIQFGKIIFITVLVVSLDGLLQYFNETNILGMKSSNPFRLSGFFGDELILGSYISKFIPIIIAIGFAEIRKNKRHISLLLILICLMQLVVFLSGERVAFFNVILFNFIIFLLFFKIHKFIIALSVILSSLFIIFVLFFGENFSKFQIKERMIGQTLEQISSNKVPYMPYSPHHEAHYISALKMFKDQPIIGKGPNLFRKLCSIEKYSFQNSCSTHPHNFYIQLLAETGLIGFLFLFISFFIISKKIFLQFTYSITGKINLQFNNSCMLLYVALFILIWPFTPSVNFFNQQFNAILYIPVGLIIFHYFYQKNISDV